MNELYLFRFVGGEDVLAELENETDTTITVSKPAIILTIPQQNGTMNVQMLPWTQFSEEKSFVVSKTHLYFKTKPVIDLVNNYNRMFGSGIQIATAIPK
jgi:hypothetical protein